MNRTEDNDLREALRRREAKRQPTTLSDDFLGRVMQGIEEQEKQSLDMLKQGIEPSVKRHSRRITLAALAAAASILLLLAGGTLALTRPWHAADEEECVAYIYGERTTDRTQVLAEMQRTMSQAATPDGTADAVEQQLKAMFAND